VKRMVLAITGASGVIYGIRVAEELLSRDFEVHLIASDAACIVLEQELDWDFSIGRAQTFYRHLPGSNLVYYDNDDIAAVLASGSFQNQGMIVMPCTMSTLSAIAHGSSDNLITRVADVMLKEKRQLILVPRETPLNTIHLRNMLLLSEMGVNIVPAMPGFYSKPTSINEIVDFLVGKVLDIINIPNDLYHRYV
jgi:4-hydroxy-3-polyprenylbenzoate decarboxylase